MSKAVALAKNVKRLFVASVNEVGLPHLAVAGRMSIENDDSVNVTEWFCPQTIINLQSNNKISIVVWEQQSDVGYQLLGKTIKIEDLAMLDGYMPEEEKSPLPQVQRKLVIKVKNILSFTLAPHSDKEAT